MCGDACVVEGEEYGVVYAQVAAAQACFEFFDFGEGALVAQVELVLGVPLAFDEGGLDEQLAGLRRRLRGRTVRGRSA